MCWLALPPPHLMLPPRVEEPEEASGGAGEGAPPAGEGGGVEEEQCSPSCSPAEWEQVVERQAGVAAEVFLRALTDSLLPAAAALPPALTADHLIAHFAATFAAGVRGLLAEGGVRPDSPLAR